MKMVIAYVESDAFEPIREALIDVGIASISVLQAAGSVPDSVTKATYRGITVERHLRPKTRIECVVSDELADTVVETVLEHAADRRFVVAGRRVGASDGQRRLIHRRTETAWAP